jgi:GTP-binding protein
VPRLSASPELPLVAIVGRANVGKSTLFNCLVRKQRALVEDLPGVTRDRVAAPARVEGREILLVDTGGLDPQAEGPIWHGVQRQVRRVLQDAALVVLVTSAREGLLPLDSWIAELARSSERPVLLVVNKADGLDQDSAAAEFHKLGFADVLPVSAAHRRGMRDLEVAIAAQLPPPVVPAPRPEGEPAPLALALIGRPNVGKSSLFNCLVREEVAIVDATPGTTRDAHDTWIEYKGRSLVLIDTAGLRRAARRSERVERGSAFLSLRAIERADAALLLIDATEGVTDQEQRIARLAFERGRPLLLVCNKWDAVRDPQRKAALESEIERKLGFLREASALYVSARTGKGVGRILPAAIELAEQSQLQVSTADVNRMLREAVAHYPPPLSARRRVQLFYATQIASQPLTILIFVNDPALVSTSYRRYIESSFRKQLGLRAAPLRIRLRARSRPERGERGERSAEPA